jgi:maleylpyruvate isomerase
VIGDHLFDQGRLQDLRLHLIGSTQGLLGDTIGLSDDEWQSPSALPGWTRAHIASHLAQGAQSLTAVAERLAAGESGLEWPVNAPDNDLESESRRRAVLLQVALDTSAGRFLETLDRLDEAAWRAELVTPAGPVPALALTYARLNEVVLHHLDLRLGLALADLDPQAVAWLLAWNAWRRDRDMRHLSLHLLSDEGVDLTIGSGAQVFDIRGASASLLGWLTGRLGPSAVLGAEYVDLGGPV